MAKTENALSLISGFLTSVREKRAADGQSDPGTTHPVENAEDNTMNVQTGARAAENESDIEKQVGPASVDSTPEGGPSDDSSTPADSIGTISSSAEEMKGNVPTPKPDSDKDVPPSALPEKTAFEQEYAAVAKQGNEIAAELSMILNKAAEEDTLEKKDDEPAGDATPTDAAPTDAAPATPAAAPAEGGDGESGDSKKAAIKYANDFRSGYQAAETLSALASQDPSEAGLQKVASEADTLGIDQDFVKSAAEGFAAGQKRALQQQQVVVQQTTMQKKAQEEINATLVRADDDAKCFAKLMKGYNDGVTKRAQLEAAGIPPELLEQAGAMPPGAMPPGAMPPEGIPPEAMMAPGGPDMPPPEMMPEGGEDVVTDPGAALEEAGEPMPEELSAEDEGFINELQEAGVTPDDIIEAVGSGEVEAEKEASTTKIATLRRALKIRERKNLQHQVAQLK